MVDVEDFIMHYQSQYYDPAKAHEYYLKTRDLKGRDPKTLSKSDRKVWSQTQANIGKAKSEELKSINPKQKEELARFQRNAETKRVAIHNSIANLLASIKANQNNQIKSDFSSQKTAASKQGSEQAAAKKQSTKVELARVSSELKTSVGTARTKYKGLREQLVAKYESVYTNEFNAIKNGA